MIKQIESQVPKAYLYKLEQDAGVTGRFEVTVFQSREDLEANKNGELIHSKKQSGRFPPRPGQGADAPEFWAKVKGNTEQPGATKAE